MVSPGKVDRPRLLTGLGPVGVFAEIFAVDGRSLEDMDAEHPCPERRERDAILRKAADPRLSPFHGQLHAD
jgi:hypothetical protein